MEEAPLGIDVEGVSAWLADHVEGAKPPFGFELIAAGGSNLTFEVTDTSEKRWALRRPPVGDTLPTAHDMGREWRIISALQPPGLGVPVPAAVASCDDPGVTGAPFYVMGFVDGLILRDETAAADLTAEQCRTATESLVDVQVAFHTIDIDSVGLGALGRRDGYVERQLARWMKQYVRADTRELPLLRELHDRLAARVPRAQGVGLAHGDYRFDNTVLSEDCTVDAVLDWELCTVGDPVADFCWSLGYWADPGDDVAFLASSPTLNEGFPRRAEVADLYAERSGFDLGDLDYFTAFSRWKMACIVEGVYSRRLARTSGGMVAGEAEAIGKRAMALLEQAGEAAQGVV